MKRKLISLFIGFLILFILSTIILIKIDVQKLVDGVGSYKTDNHKIGDRIDSYKNVDVYYNGIDYTKSYGTSYSEDGYYYGLKWQCVEFVKRFYYEVKKHKMPEVYGNAKDFFDSKVPQGKLNKSRGMLQYRNGESERPQQNDLMVLTDTKYGHVAIVTSVTDEYVEVIQQNIYGSPRDKYPVKKIGNKYFVGEKRKPAGWLRLE